MEEVTLLDFNRDRGNQPKLVALYPKEGTFYSDNPYIVLHGGWVTSAQKTAAASSEVPRAEGHTAGRCRVRVPSRGSKDRVGEADLCGERRRSQAAHARAGPAGAAGAGRDAQALARRPQARERAVGLRHVRVDERQNRLVRARQGVEAFFREVAPQDRVGLTIFSDRIQPLIPIRRFSENKAGAARGREDAHRRRRHRHLRRDRRRGAGRLRSGRHHPHQRGRGTHRRRGHRLETDVEQVVSRLGAQGDSRNRVRVY